MSSVAPAPIPTSPMLRRSAGLALLGLLMAASPSAQESQESSPSPLHPLVQAVLRQFPEIEGEVLEVQGGTVRIGLGARDGLPVEAELILFRRGRELRHPRTGQLLGHVEEPLGRVAVQAVREGDATARLLEPPPGAMPRPGDRVRTARGPIRLGLLTLTRPEAAGGGGEDPLAAALASELEATGRFRPIFADRLKAGLPGEVLSADGVLGAGDRLAEFRRAFGVDYLLVATLRPAATETALEVRLLSLAQRRPLMTATELLGTLARLALAPRRPAPPSPPPEPDAIKAGGEPVPLARSAILRSFFASPRDRRRGDALPLAEIGSLGQFALAVDAAEPRAAGASPQLVLTDGESVSFYRLTP
ncbi:MAG: hypothetical protein HYV61_06845 [Candidatus Rokubacteria bacterium]|nr:hypothetical protein [Candidatus Rokubacteria bacterium]